MKAALLAAVLALGVVAGWKLARFAQHLDELGCIDEIGDESNRPLRGAACDHTITPLNPHWSVSREAIRDEFGRDDPELPWRREMGVEWMSRQEAREAIPPAYTEHIGRQLIDQLACAA